MKEFMDISFDPARCRRELKAFQRLLQSKEDLGERDDIQPFFRRRHQLSAFIGTFAPDIGPATRLAMSSRSSEISRRISCSGTRRPASIRLYAN
jgi:hypothetical protein